MADVARINDAQDPDGEDVDLDLDAEDVLLREAIGQPVRVKVDGKVLEIPHPSDWPTDANAAAARSDFDGWAALVLSDGDLRVWRAAHLRNYQTNAIFEQVAKRTGAGPGKPPASRGSSRSKRQR